MLEPRRADQGYARRFLAASGLLTVQRISP
jgi:hypothetical protein